MISLRISSHLLLSLLCILLISKLASTNPVTPKTDDLRTRMFVQAGTTLLGLWVLSLGEMLGGRRKDVELRSWMGWGEGFAGLASSLFWTVVVIPQLVEMASSSTRTYLLLLSSAVSLLAFASWSAYVFELIRDAQRKEQAEISLLLDIETARPSFDEKKVDDLPTSPSDASSNEEESSTEMLTESPLFLGLLLGGSLTCLMAGAWMTAILGYSPAALFIIPSILSVTTLGFAKRQSPSFAIFVTSILLLLQYQASMTFTLSHRGAPTCGIFAFEALAVAFDDAPLLCALSRSLYYVSWITLSGLVARLFGLHLAGRRGDEDEEDEDDGAWGWKEEVHEIKRDVARALGVSLEGRVRI